MTYVAFLLQIQNFMKVMIDHYCGMKTIKLNLNDRLAITVASGGWPYKRKGSFVLRLESDGSLDESFNQQ